MKAYQEEGNPLKKSLNQHQSPVDKMAKATTTIAKKSHLSAIAQLWLSSSPSSLSVSPEFDAALENQNDENNFQI